MEASQLKITTRYGKGFEDGYCKALVVKGVTLGLPTLGSNSKGNERFSIGRADPVKRCNDYLTASVWRNAHDNVHWCYQFGNHYGDPGYKFHGTGYKKVEEVIRHIISWLVGTTIDDSEVIKGAKQAIKLLDVSDDVPKSVRESSYISRGGK